jgi:CRISPR-associated protein Csb2
MPEQERHIALAALARLSRVTLPGSQVADVQPYAPTLGGPLQLERRTWCEASRHWSTVTPVLLDRPPKRAGDEQVAHALAQSLAFAGFAEPVEVGVRLRRSTFLPRCRAFTRASCSSNPWSVR